MLMFGTLSPACEQDKAPADAPSPAERASAPSLEPELVSATPAKGELTGELDRRVLPILPPPRPRYTALDVREVEKPARFEVKAPEGAPNVLVVLIDDFGFGVSSTFGGPVETPTMD